MPEFEIDPSISRRAFEGVEGSFKPGGWVSRQLDALGQKGLLPGGSQNRFVDSGLSLASAVAHNTSRFDTIATGQSGKFGRDLWRMTWMEAKNQEAVINRQNEAAGLNMSEHVVRNQALKTAIAKKGGTNYEHWITFLKAAEREHGPAKAAFLANHLQLMMGDEPYSPMKFRWDAEGNLKRSKELRYETSDLFKHVMSDPQLSQSLEGRWHPARKADPIAKGFQGLARASHFALAPAAALKHMSQFPGLMSNMTSFENGLTTLQAFFGKGREDAMAMMKANDAAADMFTEMSGDIYRYKTGWYSKAKWLNPKLGMWIARQGATPGLRSLRYRLIPMAAAQGHFVLHEAAGILEDDPSNVAARVNLQYLGLRPEEVMHEWAANNGSFARDERGVSETIKTAVNNSIEQRVFYNNPGYRAALALSPMGRFATTYHWMGQNEKSWFQREWVRAYQSRNPVQIASLIATMSLAYPGVHWAMAKVNDVLIGKRDPEEAGEEMFDPINDAKAQADLMQTYIDMTGWGTEWSKVNATLHHNLLEASVGAQGKAGVNLIQDFAHGGVDVVTGGHDAYPFYRDVLEDMPLHIGSRIAHAEFPTRAEIEAKKPMTRQRMAAKQAAEKRKYLNQ